MKKINMTPKCDRCGTRYPIHHKKDVPTIVGFVKGKKTYNVCYMCMSKLGSLKTEEEKAKFFKEVGIND